MSQGSVYEGTKDPLYEIARDSVDADWTRSVSLENLSFPSSYSLGPTHVVVPDSPPLWTPQNLPIGLPPDAPPVDPRTILRPCPLDAMFRAIGVTSPELVLRDFDLITDRKNLRALFNFFKHNNHESHRIDAELLGDTLLFYLGWSEWGYSSSGKRHCFGMNFERQFTSPLTEATIQHNRVIAYSFGGLRVMVKYQVDACLGPLPPPPFAQPPAFVTPTGLRVVPSGTIVPPESIAEIKTLRKGSGPFHPRTMEQLWFSQTPILVTGYHDGNGQFSSVETTAMSDALKLWEQQNTAALQRVIRLLEMIKEHLSQSPIKRQAIVLYNRGRFASVKFFSLVDDSEQEGALPEDLRELWSG